MKTLCYIPSSGSSPNITRSTKATCSTYAEPASSAARRPPSPVLSSAFVQRGEPALADKWTRAEAALACGADLVLELPVLFSAHNAGVFANGAVDILAAARAVTHLSFGAENPDCLTDNIIDMILEEPEAFKLSLKKHLAEGFSFVEARARAAEEIIPGSARVLAGSNNTLALAYMARIKKKNYALAPLPVLREGAAYNSERLEEIASAARDPPRSARRAD